MPRSRISRFKKCSKPPTFYYRSTLENYANCPFMADAVDNDKVQDISKPALAGQEGHRIIAEAWEFCEQDNQAAINYLSEEMPKARPDLQPEVVDSLKHFAGEMQRIDPWRIISVEKEYSATFFEATTTEGPILVACCPDLLVGGRDETSLHIYDWKTGYKRWSSGMARNAFQTCLYSYVLFKEMPQVDEIHFWYYQTRYQKRAYCKLTREHDFDNLKGRVGEALRYALLKSNQAWPEPDKCAWCPATAICPHVIAEARDFNKGPAEYLNQYIALKARLSKMAQTMNAHVRNTGQNIVAGENVYGDPGRGQVNFKVFKNEAVAGDDEKED